MTEMTYRRLGESGLRVSALALGGWINFEEKIPEDEARAIVTTAYDRGVNFFDLADVYGHGKAEAWMGGMLSDFPRHTLVLSSKVFWPMSDDVNDRGLSRKHILESIDKSLARLGTDYVDLYFCHRADPETPLLETARAMDHLVRQGKVLYWGTSEWPAEKLVEVHGLCDRHGLYPPLVEQPEYSMLVRERVEEEVVPTAAARGMGLVTWSPLAMGMLTGKYDDGVPEGSRLDRIGSFRKSYLTDENVARVRELADVARERGCTRAQLALAWILRLRTVSSVITGATALSQLEENLGALDVELDGEALARIDAILDPSRQGG